MRTLAVLFALAAPAAAGADGVVLLRGGGAGAHVHRGDWEPPDAVLLGHLPGWRGTLRAVVEAVGPATPTYLVLAAGDDVGEVRGWLEASGLGERPVRLLPAGVDTPWVRDYGPVQVRVAAGGRRWLDAVYAASRPGDDAFPQAASAAFGVEGMPLDLRLEGGALISDGRGLCVTTDATLAVSDDPEVRDELLAALGCDAVAVVPPLSAEDTGHVDLFAQFLGPRTVAVARADPGELPDDAARLDEAAATIARAAAALGRELEVVRLPLHHDGDGLYTAYANGLHVPGAFLMPSYADAVPPEVEAEALATLRAAMPGRAVVPVPIRAVAAHGGALHCIAVGVSLR